MCDDGNVQQENERIKQSRDTEEKLMVTAWYNLVCCKHLQYSLTCIMSIIWQQLSMICGTRYDAVVWYTYTNIKYNIFFHTIMDS